MDKTETYIKMCDCEEIQAFRRGQLHFEEGDWFVIRHQGMIDYFTELNRPHPNVRVMADNGWSRDRYEEVGNCIWLPLQGQLQEMITDGKPFWKILQDFLFWFSANLEIQAVAAIKKWTGEQLWLAFVMKEKYNKVWNGTEWIKAEVEDGI